MANNSEHTAHGTAAAPNNTKLIMRTLGILTVITIMELVVGMFIAPGMVEKNHSYKIWFNIFYLICTLAKAYYIVSEFMHLGHEVKNLIMTIIGPLTLFIWFIIAFLWEGNSYKNLRDTHNPQKPVPAKVESHSGGGHSTSTSTHATAH